MAVKKKERSILEDSDVVVERLESAEDFFKTNQKWVFLGVGIVFLAIAGIFGYNYYKNSQTEEAHAELFRPIYYFEGDSLGKALKGDGNTLGFLKIADEFGNTKPGNLAHFYAGVSYLKESKYQQAIDQLKEFSSSDILVQARAYSLIGDAYMELKNYNDAVTYYEKAAKHKPNKFFTPIYLMKQGLASEKKGDNQAAIKVYEQIIEEYFDSSEYTEARKNKSRLEALSTK